MVASGIRGVIIDSDTTCGSLYTSQRGIIISKGMIPLKVTANTCPFSRAAPWLFKDHIQSSEEHVLFNGKRSIISTILRIFLLYFSAKLQSVKVYSSYLGVSGPS